MPRLHGAIKTKGTASAVLLSVVLALSVALVFRLVLVRHSDRRSSRYTHTWTGYPIAPDFSLTDLNGGAIQLSTYRGKVVILDYWASWCAPCKIEIPRLIELQKLYNSKGLQVIGISMDDGPEAPRTFSHVLGIDYPVALGDVKVAEAYGGVLGLPVAFLIDRQGRIRRKLAGDRAMQSLESDVRELLNEP